MTEYLTTTNKKPWMKIGATDANITNIVCDNLEVDGSVILPPGFELTNVIIDTQTNIGDVFITPTIGNTFNLKTPTAGLIGDVLKTDGAGNTYWGVAGGIGSGIVYNGILPIPVGKHTIISVDGLELTQSKVTESVLDLDVDGLNLTNANDIYANQIKNISGNVLNFDTDDSITILNDQSLLTTKTSFTLDQELITKKYVDDAIPLTTFQDVYNNSANPSEVLLVDNKPIIFKDTLDQVAFTISSNGLTTEAGGFNGGFYTSKMNQIKRADNLDTQIQVIEDIPLTTIRTTFTEDQEFITKLYVDTQVAINPFDQSLNTTDNVNFNKVNVTAAITENTQLTTKLYVDSAISVSTQDFQGVYNASLIPAKIEMTGNKNINYTRNDNPILTLNSLNYKLTSQDISVAQITSNNYFPPNSNNLNNWSLSPYNFTASASSFINFAHEPGTSFTYVAVVNTDGWISDNNNYDLITGLATTLVSTLVNGSPVIGEWLQLLTSIAVSINGFYYGGLIDTGENDTAVDFQLVGSNDGTNFTLLSAQTAQTILYPGKQYTIPSTIAYKYYRFIIQSIEPNNLYGRCAVGSGTAFDIIPTNPAKIRLLDDAIEIDGSYLTATNFIKQGGTNQQYLMADGSSLQYSQNSGNSNFYLYDSQNNTGSPPVPNGHIEYNNSIQANATILYISHLTSDAIDIDVFFAQITTIQDVYIQDKNSSLNFIKYNITGTPTLVPNDYISIPVLYTATIPPALPNGAGTGLTSFGGNHPVIISFFTNSIEVDLRLTTLETKTQYQTASANTTTFSGAGGIISNGGFKLNPTTTNFLLADGTSIAQSSISSDVNLQNKVWATYQINFSQAAVIVSQNLYLPPSALVTIGSTTTTSIPTAVSTRTRIFKVQNPTLSVGDGQKSGYSASIIANTWPVFFGRTGVNWNVSSGIGDSNTTTNAVTQMFEGFTITSVVPSFSSLLGPNATPSIIGFGHDVGDSVLSFYFRGTASGVKIATPFLASTPSPYWFNFNIYNACNSDLFTLTLTDIITGLTATQNFTMAIGNTAVMSPNDRLFCLSCRAMGVGGGVTNSAITQFSRFQLSLK